MLETVVKRDRDLGTPARVSEKLITLTIDGQVRQDGNSALMLNPIVPMIQHICGHFSLQPGDVILTGTPVGVGPLAKGDALELELVGQASHASQVL